MSLVRLMTYEPSPAHRIEVQVLNVNKPKQSQGSSTTAEHANRNKRQTTDNPNTTKKKGQSLEKLDIPLRPEQLQF